MTTEPALAGRTIAVTRPRTSSDSMADALSLLGASVLRWPVFIVKTNTESRGSLLNAVKDARWIVFTSANAVDCFVELAGSDAVGDRAVASIGPATTAALANHGLRPDVVARIHTAEGMVEAMRTQDGLQAGQKVLYPHAEDARAVLANGLSELGANVVSVVTYRKTIERDAIRVDSPPDAVTFASGSAARCLDKLVTPAQSLSAIKQQSVAACIGPATANVVAELGYRNVLSAQIHTGDGLVAALIERFS